MAVSKIAAKSIGCLNLAADHFRNSYLYGCSSNSQDFTNSEYIFMSRSTPPNNGKPIKTEPGLIQPINRNDKTDKSQTNQPDQMK